MNSEDVIRVARQEVEAENFREAVERQKVMLRWPWYKKLFPYRIEIKIKDLRKAEK